MTIQTFSPTQINAYIKMQLEHDEILQDLWIQGEITQLKRYNLGGQVYFYLNDGDSQINCVMYDRYLDNVPFQPENGQLVSVRGSIKTFHRKGTYCFQAVFMKLGGNGLVNQELEKLKAKLFQEGLFDETHKKPLLKLPKKVAIITAWNSAAMWDVVKVIRERHTSIQLCIVEAVMQGQDSAKSIQNALKKCESYGQFDTILITRGGGSAQDLSSFNDEALVRAIYACSVPVITAIGHEIDTTLADLVSDLRCPTPTAAAKHLSEGYADLFYKTSLYLKRMNTLLQQRIIKNRRQAETIFDDTGSAVQTLLDDLKERIQRAQHRIDIANPLHKLGQGFSITSRFEDKITLNSIKTLQADDILQTYFKDGLVTSKIQGIEEKNWYDIKN